MTPADVLVRFDGIRGTTLEENHVNQRNIDLLREALRAALAHADQLKQVLGDVVEERHPELPSTIAQLIKLASHINARVAEAEARRDPNDFYDTIQRRELSALTDELRRIYPALQSPPALEQPPPCGCGRSHAGVPCVRCRGCGGWERGWRSACIVCGATLPAPPDLRLLPGATW